MSGVPGRKGRAADRQGLAEERLGLGELALVRQKTCEVVETQRDVRVPGGETGAVNLKCFRGRAARPRKAFSGPAGASRGLLRLIAMSGVPGRKGTRRIAERFAKERLGLGKPVLGLQDERDVVQTLGDVRGARRGRPRGRFAEPGFAKERFGLGSLVLVHQKTPEVV